MKAIALPLVFILNALIGAASALPYKHSAKVIGLLGMLYAPVRAYWWLKDKQVLHDAEAERAEIESNVKVMFAKRAEKA